MTNCLDLMNYVLTVFYLTSCFPIIFFLHMQKKKSCIPLPHGLMPILVKWGTMDFQTLFCYVLLAPNTLKYSNKNLWGLSCIMKLDNLIIHPFHPLHASITIKTDLLQTSLNNESAPLQRGVIVVSWRSKKTIGITQPNSSGQELH